MTISSEKYINQAIPSGQHEELLFKLCYDPNQNVAKEAIFVLCNSTSEGSFRRKHEMIRGNFLIMCRDKLLDPSVCK